MQGPTKALIYCRVSSDRQVNEGNGLSSQEKRCRDYAMLKNYVVKKVFYDEGVSGGLFDRPAMKELIAYLDSHSVESFVVIFDDLSRFARDVKVHIQLKAELVSRGAKLECLNFSFNESEESEYAELVLAAGNQYQRKSNRRQVIQKMKARIDAGYWPFCYPPGLINIKHPLHGKLLTPKEPYASIFKQTIENYKDGLLNTFEQVRDFLNAKYKETGINHSTSISGAQNILQNPLYAGWIEYKPWGVPLQKGKHEGFITKGTFDLVQAKIHGKSLGLIRKDHNIDFPLRGFILCNSCKKAMTASWHKGRNRKYAHYHCKQSDCLMFGKVVQREIVELKFETLLSGLKPNKDIINFSKSILLDIWKNRDKVDNDNQLVFRKEFDHLEAKKTQLIDRVTKTNNELLIQTYEEEIKKIIKRQEEIKSNQPLQIYSQNNFGTACDLIFPRLENPVTTWQSPNYKDKRLLLEMFFEEKITYDFVEGLGTATLAPLPKLLCMKEASETVLVEMPRIELGSEETLLKKFS